MTNSMFRKSFDKAIVAVVTVSAFLSQAQGATVGFNIDLNYINGATESQMTAFENAEATWEGIITGYKDTVGSANTTITIDVNLSNIDGAGGTLGSAGPTFVFGTTNFVYASDGQMTFDTSDTPALEANGTFEDVILHEMGHVLGIGTLWSSSAIAPTLAGRQEVYVDGSGEYTGAAGVAAYNEEFAQAGAFVPVELGGGQGTANGHWNEVDNGAAATGIVSLISGNDLRNELMTGWLNAPLFISNLTIASMQDIGYDTVALAVVPEPSSILISGLGLGLIIRRRRSR